jgi:AP-3 complex subunit delta-1
VLPRQAVRKLTYLQMMGYDMCWAAFSIVEVMSAPRFAHKRIGYLAACQTFTESTDVVLLCTNLLKKEFQSPNQYEVGQSRAEALTSVRPLSSQGITC